MKYNITSNNSEITFDCLSYGELFISEGGGPFIKTCSNSKNEFSNAVSITTGQFCSFNSFDSVRRPVKYNLEIEM